MTFYKQVSLDLTPQQMRKLAGGKPAQLTADQIMSTMKKIYVHPLNFDKIMKAKKKNSGTRFQISPDAIKYDLEQLKGGSVWSFLKNTLWPAIKPAISSALDLAVAPLSTAAGPYAPAVPIGRSLIKNLTGVGAKTIKGSQEAKDKMAKLRAMKKGAGFRLN